MKVAVLGMGVIGKRVADAVADHPELDLVGVGIRRLNGAALARPGYSYFLTEGERADEFAAAGINVAGDWSDALKRAELVVDAGPSRSGAGRAGSYEDAGVAVRYCGGERARTLGPVLHSALNRELGTGRRSARLASCNTTAIGRVVAAVGIGHIQRVHATIVRCCTDTDKAAKGVTNSAVFDARLSHHASDLREIVPDLPIASHAITVPMVSGHLILLDLELWPGTADAVAAGLAAARGVELLPDDRPHDTATIRADALDAAGGRGDRHHVAVQMAWESPTRLTLCLSLDNEAITIPETVDAVVAYAR